MKNLFKKLTILLSSIVFISLIFSNVYAESSVIYPSVETRIYNDSNIADNTGLLNNSDSLPKTKTNTYSHVIPVDTEYIEPGYNAQLSLIDSQDVLHFNSMQVSYYNLLVNYSSNFDGFIEMTVAYIDNSSGLLMEEKVTVPVRAGISSYTVPNWKSKNNIYLSTGQSVPHIYSYVICTSIRRLVIR